MISIELKNVKKHYHNGTIEYKNYIFKAEKTILLGENGSGKSTLLKAIAGLVNYEGEINVDATLSYLPENPSFPKDVSVMDFLVALNAYNEKLLRDFHLMEHQTKKLSSLSKGMKQKVNIIQTLSVKASWYLFDEPAEGLDEETLNILITILRHLKSKWILATHRLKAFESLDALVISLD
jgi:ABC-type multidrug transport system ATPase subunit